MTTAYTSLLGLALPVTGELSGTWGDTVNTAITSLLDTAVAGTTSITTDADITLTTTTGASNQARQAIILWNPASGTVTRNITAPAQSKIYTVINASGGTQSVVIRGAGPTTGVTIAKGESATVAWNGSDFVKVGSSGGAITFTDLTVTGNTILGDAAADTLTVNATSTFASPVNFANLVRLPNGGRGAAAALTVTAPAFLYGVASTYTDTTSSGTIAAMAPFYSIAQPTLSTSNVTTYTNAATLYLANAPVAGGSATITNPYALYIAAGANYFGGATTFNSTTQFNGVATHSANVLFSADNTYDIGASGATRPRTLYLGTSVITPLIDATNVEATNIKALDGTSAASIANSTGVISFVANPILSGGTANGVLYLNGSKVATSGSALTYDAVTLANDTGSTSGTTGFSASNSVANGYTSLILRNTGASGKTYEVGMGGNGVAANYQNNFYIRDTTGSPLIYLNSTTTTVTNAFQNVRATGADTFINHVTTGINNTVLGFNNSGSTNSSGVLNNTAYVGSLNTYSTAVVGNGAVIATFQASSVGSQGIYVNGVVNIAQSGVFPTTGFTYNTNGYLYTMGGTSGAITQVGGVNVTTTTSSTFGVSGLVTVTSSTANSAITVTQTSATGYGITIIPGADTYDALTINNAANSANNIRMFGSGSASFAGDVTTGNAVTYRQYSQNFSVGTTQWIRLCGLGNPGTMKIRYFLGSGNSEEYGEVFINTTYVAAQQQIQVSTQSYNNHLLEVRLVGTSGGTNNVFFNIRSDSLAPRIEWTAFDVRSPNGLAIYNDTTTPGAATASLTIPYSGTSVNLTATNGIFGAFGGGVQFPATQVASGNANTLDDYEEGTWTPTLATNGFSGTPTLSSSSGIYTKTGRVVTVRGALSFGSTFTYPSGYVLIGGLPFTPSTGFIGSFAGGHPGSGPMGGACAAFSSGIDAAPTAATTTSTQWTYTVTYFV